MRSEKIETMKRRLAAGAAMAGVAVVAGLTLTAGSAQAQTTGIDAEILAGGCASGYFCGWENSGYSGDKWVNWRVGGVGTVYEIDGWDGDNEISSFSNESSRKLRIYNGDNATGASICIGAGDDVRNLNDEGAGGGAYNDWMESIKVVASC
ncbi:peptidase inhibitor family I36 protein [Glycomyces rhizosphaerae]|uniref:Peptidase inhibitor family I36 protein n=1 Tax=Glycomyces rhizosphaerae TaxID=2054422 RepID=A0ABV7PWZ4_9ACTN